MAIHCCLDGLKTSKDSISCCLCCCIVQISTLDKLCIDKLCKDTYHLVGQSWRALNINWNVSLEKVLVLDLSQR